MNDLEKWTLNEVKELLYYSSTLDYFFKKENPDFDVINHCRTEGDFGLVTEYSLIENPERPTFRLSMAIEFYCIVEVENEDENEEQTPEDREIDIYLHVNERIRNIKSGIGSLNYALREWDDLGNGERLPLASSVISILDPALGLVKIAQEYILEHYGPFNYPCKILV